MATSNTIVHCNGRLDFDDNVQQLLRGGWEIIPGTYLCTAVVVTHPERDKQYIEYDYFIALRKD